MADASLAKREAWVDNVKVIACIFVALGHFFQSMVGSSILPETDLYKWFNQTIYYFHVPLFFICSGYLYQKRSKINNFSSYKNNIINKAIALGIPYFVFSAATWIMKSGLSGLVNKTPQASLVKTLFISPLPPYWFLYSLFFIFLITPTFSSKKTMGIGLAAAIVFKVLSIVFGGSIAVISYTLANEIWFVIGMCLAFVDFTKYAKKAIWLGGGFAGIVVFAALSVATYFYKISNGFVSFLLGLLACLSIIAIIAAAFQKGQSKMWAFCARYTMPVFLMHTIFAAALRILLIKLGIMNPAVHIMLGIAFSFIGPIAAAKIMNITKWLEFLIYPGKFVKIGKSKA